LVEGQCRDVENHIEDIDIEDHAVKGEGQGHGQDQIDVDPWGHDEERLVLRDRVQSIGHLNGDQDGESHGHSFWGLEDFARDSLEVFG